MAAVILLAVSFSGFALDGVFLIASERLSLTWAIGTTAGIALASVMAALLCAAARNVWLFIFLILITFAGFLAALGETTPPGSGLPRAATNALGAGELSYMTTLCVFTAGVMCWLLARVRRGRRTRRALLVSLQVVTPGIPPHGGSPTIAPAPLSQ